MGHPEEPDFPRPLFASVTNEGEIHLEWIDGPQGGQRQKRLNIWISDDETSHGRLVAYAHILGPGNNPGDHKTHWLNTPGDVLRVLREYMSR